jgi:hypothetical protein
MNHYFYPTKQQFFIYFLVLFIRIFFRAFLKSFLGGQFEMAKRGQFSRNLQSLPLVSMYRR